MSKVILIAHDIRSTHNVGSFLRTADCLGADMVYLTGYTPYPLHDNDQRLPHLAAKLNAQIHKTALGAELTTKWAHETDINSLVKRLRSEKFQIVALEQSPKSEPLPKFKISGDTAVIVGNEVVGIDESILNGVDKILEIPMYGSKESLNVAQATAIALYQLCLT